MKIMKTTIKTNENGILTDLASNIDVITSEFEQRFRVFCVTHNTQCIPFIF